MRLLVKVTIGCLLALLPGTTLAYSIQNVGSSVSASTSQNLYRLRAVGKTWQLSALTADQLADAPSTFNGKLIFTAKTGNLTKVVVSSGLDAQPLPGLTGDAIKLVKRDVGMIAASQTGSVITAALIKPDFSVTQLPDLPLTSLDQTDRFFSFGGELYYGEQLNQFVRINHWKNSAWEVVASFPCAVSNFTAAPLAGFACAEGQYYFPLTAANWQPLFPISVQNFNASGGVIAASDVQNNLYVWQNNSLTTYALNLAGRTIQSLKIAADRVFLKLSDASWWEFNLGDHSLSSTPGDVSNLTAADNASRLFVKIGASFYVSDAPGSWQIVTAEGDFSNLKKVVGGWLAWAANGAVAQFAADSTTAFHKVTSSWATSSKIQAVYGQDNLGLILLLNSSNNPNLYQSTDFQTWSRVTLPTTPTFVVTINAARALPANSLAEVTGIISVSAGAVSGESLYLQDDTGGLQIFLDSSKGVLPPGVNKTATATGQISSSQTKHLVLAALDDLAIGANQTLTLGQLPVDELTSHLGLATTTQATISDAGSGYFSLGLTSGSLKFHYPTGLLNFIKDSVVKLPLVTDYNSASGAVESWYLGTGAALVSAPAAGATTASTATVITTALSSAPTKTLVKAKTAAAKTSSLSISTTSPTLISNSQKVATPTLVSGAKENDFAQTFALAVASFLAGALAMRGRRLQELLRWR